MKTLLSALIISASVVAGTAYAGDSSTITRAQVIAELQQARAAGLVSQGELDYPPEIKPHSTLSAAQVKADLAAAIAAGKLSTGELDYPPEKAAGDSKSRAEVKAELQKYLSSGAHHYVGA